MATLSYVANISGGSGSSAYNWSMTRTYTYNVTENEKGVVVNVTKYTSSAITGSGGSLTKQVLAMGSCVFRVISGGTAHLLSRNHGENQNISLNDSFTIPKNYVNTSAVLAIADADKVGKSVTISIPKRELTEIQYYDDDGNKQKVRVKVVDPAGDVHDCVLCVYDDDGVRRYPEVNI